MSITKSMRLEIQQRTVDEIIIVDLDGKLVLGPEDSLARQEILSVLDRGGKNVIVNMKELSSLDTAGIGTLTFCARKFHEAGGRLVLVDSEHSHTKTWDVLKLNTAVDIYEDEVAAINSFYPERETKRYDILEFVEGQKAH